MLKVEQTEKEKRVVGNMRGYGVPRMTSLDHYLYHQYNRHRFMSVSPISSSSFSGGLSSSEAGFAPSIAQMDQSMHRTPSTHYLDSPVVKNSNEYMLDEIAWRENLQRMNLGEALNDYSKFRRFPRDPEGFGLSGCSMDGTSPCILENYGTFEGFTNDVHGYEGFQSSISGNSTSFDDDMKAKLLGLCQEYNAGNLRGSHLTHNHSNSLYSEPSCYKDRIDYVMDQRKQQGRGSCNGGLQLHNPSMNRPYLTDELCCSERLGMDFYGDTSLLNPANSSQLVHPNLDLSLENPICNSSMLKEKSRTLPNGRVPPSFLSETDAGDVEAFSCKGSFIIQGKSLKYVVDKRCNLSKGRKKKSCNEIAMQNQREKRQELHGQSQLKGICESSLSPRNYSPWLLQPTCSSLAQLQGYIYYMTKDQNGCRFLQRIFDEGTRQDVQIIFNEIINHVVELMMNPFGNYLMQKLLEVCSEEQRMQIVLMVTEEPGDLV